MVRENEKWDWKIVKLDKRLNWRNIKKEKDWRRKIEGYGRCDDKGRYWDWKRDESKRWDGVGKLRKGCEGWGSKRNNERGNRKSDWKGRKEDGNRNVEKEKCDNSSRCKRKRKEKENRKDWRKD